MNLRKRVVNSCVLDMLGLCSPVRVWSNWSGVQVSVPYILNGLEAATPSRVLALLVQTAIPCADRLVVTLLPPTDLLIAPIRQCPCHLCVHEVTSLRCCSGTKTCKPAHCIFPRHRCISESQLLVRRVSVRFVFELRTYGVLMLYQHWATLHLSPCSQGVVNEEM